MANEGRNFIKERKEAITRATKKQREACAIVYAEHCRVCESNDVKPTPFDVFFSEWLHCARGDQMPPTAQGNGDALRDDDEYLYEGHGRNYERLYEGKKGWD